MVILQSIANMLTGGILIYFSLRSRPVRTIERVSTWVYMVVGALALSFGLVSVVAIMMR